MSDLREVRIYGTWLTEYVGEHTCGTGLSGHYGVHEPGCGYIPLVNLSALEGWDELTADIKADAWDEGVAWERKHAAEVRRHNDTWGEFAPEHEDDHNPYRGGAA